jgi:hypothetical protein
MIAGWSKFCAWFMGWVLLALLSVQCFSLAVHQGRHSASLLGSERVQTAQAAPGNQNASQAADDEISEGNCSFCQVQRNSTGIQFAAPDFALVDPPLRHISVRSSISIPFKIIRAFTARAPPLV